MSVMKRRHFLQFAGSTLAAIGLSHVDFLRQGDRYGRVLAQSTSRKLALLVGINGYEGGVRPLNGCLTDVELQRYLLIHRFGFNPSDILVVSDGPDSTAPPTRDKILQAFEEHLIKQAKPGDVVVFHYSGHGDRIKDPTPLNTRECQAVGDCALNGTLVPKDAIPEQETDTEVVVPDIMGRTLFLLMSAINSENLTVILDSCHSGAGTRGNVVVRAANSRSRSGNPLSMVPSDRELDYQARWLSTLNLSPEQFQSARGLDIAKGVILGSAQRDQLAVDATFDGFSAGGFTYLLTRYLWQMTGSQTAETLYANLKRSTSSLSEEKRQSAQVPVFDYNPDRNAQQPLYFLPPQSVPSEAVITSANPEQIEFWLGGVASQSLKGNGKGNVFTLLDAKGEAVGEIEQSDRRGLYGYGKLIAGDPQAVAIDRLLREKVIGMPSDLSLKIGVDPSLGNEATAALAANRYIKVVALNQQEPIDYLLGRFTEALRQQQTDTAELPPIGSIGLFFQDQTIAINRSFGRPGESARDAVTRLQSTLKSLLAGQLLQAIATTSSELQIQGEIFAASGQGPRIQIASRAAEGNRAGIRTIAAAEPFKTDSTIQFNVTNLEDREVYLSCLAITGTGEIIVLYPATWDAPEEASRIDKRGSLTVPRPEDRVEFPVSGSGSLELLTLVSTAPLRNALRGLQAIARDRGISRGFVDVQGDEPLEMIDQLLSDVDGISRGSRSTAGIGPRSTADRQRSLDTGAVAAFLTVIEVVE